MPTTKAARRYATALLETAKEQESVEEVLQDVAFIHNTFEDSRELPLFLKSPVIKPDDKSQALEKLFFGEVTKITQLFIKLLVRKKRIDLLDDMMEAFIDKYNQYAGIIEVSAHVAEKLSDEQYKKLKANLEKRTAKKVNLDVVVDASLKGGMAVRIKDTVIDATVKHKLAKLEDSFLSVAAE